MAGPVFRVGEGDGVGGHGGQAQSAARRPARRAVPGPAPARRRGRWDRSARGPARGTKSSAREGSGRSFHGQQCLPTTLPPCRPASRPLLHPSGSALLPCTALPSPVHPLPARSLPGRRAADARRGWGGCPPTRRPAGTPPRRTRRWCRCRRGCGSRARSRPRPVPPGWRRRSRRRSGCGRAGGKRAVARYVLWHGGATAYPATSIIPE